MRVTLTAQDLIDFETEVADLFLDRKLHCPIHLSGGNEQELLDIFEEVQPQDWVFSGWRSHYHALLKGMPREEVLAQIIDGRSMFLSSKEHHFLCSSIVGGILPIACGVAMSLQRKGLDEKVWVFVGDMTARTGLFHEFATYCRGHRLPVRAVIEDNGLSTNTPTMESWGPEACWLGPGDYHGVIRCCYDYQRTYPHVGVGRFVQF